MVELNRTGGGGNRPSVQAAPRETEILHYLARGRSVPYIRDILVVSKSIIETHIKHIYANVGVHYKQDLIDLIEATAADARRVCSVNHGADMLDGEGLDHE